MTTTSRGTKLYRQPLEESYILIGDSLLSSERYRVSELLHEHANVFAL